MFVLKSYLTSLMPLFVPEQKISKRSLDWIGRYTCQNCHILRHLIILQDWQACFTIIYVYQRWHDTKNGFCFTDMFHGLRWCLQVSLGALERCFVFGAMDSGSQRCLLMGYLREGGKVVYIDSDP